MGYHSGWDSRKELVEHLTNNKTYSDGYQVIDSGGSGNRLYVLVSDGDDTRIVLYLMTMYKGEWGYKPVDESAGPVYHDCPLRILNKSTCTNERAVKWRQDCIEWRERKAKVRARFKELSMNREHVKIQLSIYEEPVTYLHDHSSVYFVGRKDGMIYRFRKEWVVL